MNRTNKYPLFIWLTLGGMLAYASIAMAADDPFGGGLGRPQPDLQDPNGQSLTELPFGQVPVNTSKPMTVTLKNVGKKPLELTGGKSIRIKDSDPAFSSQSECPADELAPAQICQITVTFTPTSAGKINGFLQIYHGDPDKTTLGILNKPQKEIPLSGEGVSSSTPPSTSTELPNLGQVLAFDVSGNAVTTTTAKFEGGLSVNGGTPAQTVEMTLTDSVKLTGVITPDSTHNAQTADIIVVGLYVPPEKLGVDNCDPANGDYYMMQTVPDNYCNADKSYCKSSPRSKPEISQDYSQIWVKLWDGNLQKLEALYKGASLAEPIQLTTDGVSKGFGPLYEGQFDAKGHLCINFGYRLSDGMLVFNGKTIDVMIK